ENELLLYERIGGDFYILRGLEKKLYIKFSENFEFWEVIKNIHSLYPDVPIEKLIRDIYNFMVELCNRGIFRYIYKDRSENLSCKFRILLVNVPSFFSFFLPSSYPVSLELPLGLIYLDNYFLLKNSEEVDIKILDLFDKKEKIIPSFVRCIMEYSPHLIGFTTYHVNLPLVLGLAKIAKHILPEVFITLGGPGVCVEGCEILKKNDFIDFVIKKEGEKPFYNLVRDLIENPKKKMRNIKSLIYKFNSEIIENPEDERLRNLDELPFPDPYKSLYYPPRFIGQSHRISTRRGCFYRCSYCASPVIWDREVTMRSPINVIKEIEYLVSSFDAKEIIFNDDNFVWPREWVKDFIKLLMEREINIAWACNARLENVDNEMLSLMAKAGCKKILLGIETINKEAAKSIRKPWYSKEFLIKKLREIKEKGIEIVLSFIIGLPFENKESMYEVLEFLENLNINEYEFLFLNVFPGTEFFQKKEKIFKRVNNWNLYSFLTPTVETEYFPFSQQIEFYLEFLKRKVKKNENSNI
ncbi:MAG: B12-binding domain-containing radical SAM protein, partial [candidate division WOR-3 bacterium]